MNTGHNMAISFDFSTAPRILFGSGKIDGIGEILRSYGEKVLIVSGLPDGELLKRLIEALNKSRLDWQVAFVHEEPTINVVSEILNHINTYKADTVIGFGGGSAIDAAKATAALSTNPGEITDYLEVVGRGMQFIENPLPLVAIPTTAGTGSEVTRNAVINDPAQKVKVSLRSPLLLPKVALVDPELTIQMPPDITASTGMDAITQLIEPLTSNKANPITDAFCREGLRRAVRSLRIAYFDGTRLDAREDMALASLFSGVALANAKLGLVHGFASILGGMYNAPHGAICARLLPFTIESNIKALIQRESQNEALIKYGEIAQILTGHQEAKIDDGITWLKQLSGELLIKPLRHYGLAHEFFDEVVQQTKRASSTQGNPIILTDSEMHEILEQAY
jgi:alcohol dehydrogenase class IV